VLKKIRNILIITGISLIVLMGATLGILYHYRAEVIELFVKEANKKINTPVDVEKIELDLWSQFPDVSINLEGVRVYESLELAGDYLCTADQITLSFDLLNLIFRKYDLTSLILDHAVVNMALDPYGRRNFDIMERRDSASRDSLPELSLEKIILKNMTLKKLIPARRPAKGFFPVTLIS